ncbi:ArgE/DapE family deacylase [Natronorubrum sp. A-ect3]|uniref:ArgE/DapE family deacylase n=1 Tax=Natronorubrum sp. A-ect3 TaxID=3242698 RepID=UPI00359CC2DF
MSSQESRVRIDNKIESLEDDLVTLLSDLVSKQTVTGHEKPGQDLILGVFEEMGLETDVWIPDIDALEDHEGFFRTSAYDDVGFEDRPNVAATLHGNGDGPTLSINSHMDVVPATPESEWTTSPWELRREGNQLYGRGSADMKGGLAATVIAVKALQALDIELDGDLILQSTIEEEAGGTGGLLSALERGYVPDAALIPEPFDLPNVGIASAGVMYFEVSVPGESAHAAWGHEGVSSFLKSRLVVDKLEALNNRRQREIDFEPAYASDPALEGNETNINIGMVEAGDWPSTVPNETVFQGRVGWPPGESRAEIREQIETAVSAAVEQDEWLREHPPTVDWFGWNAAPHEVSTDAEIVQLAKAHAEEITGEPGEFVGGNASLDERFYQRYYDVPVVTAGPTGTNLHGVDECVTLDSLLTTSQTIARTIVDYCGTVDS